MKIVFFMESYYRGGVDTFVVNLINNWPEPSDRILLICNRGHAGIEGIEREIKRPCEIVKHRIVTFVGFFNRIKDSSFFYRIFKQALKISSPFSRYVFLMYNVFALKNLLLKGNPDRLMIINGGYPGGDSCRAACICWGIFSRKEKSIHNFHGVVVKALRHNYAQEYLIDLLMSRFTKEFITVSQAAARLMERRKILNRKNRISHIHSGIDILKDTLFLKTESIKEELDIPESSLVCLMLGNYNYNLNYNKGHSFLFKVFKKVAREISNAHLIICGYGSANDIEKIRLLALGFDFNDTIHILGFRNDIFSILKYTNVLLISAQAFESFGFVALEAMSCSVPVVTTKIGGLPEIVINGEGGYCVEKDDIDSYAGYVIKLLADEKLRKDQGRRGLERYNNYFTAARMASEYAGLIRDE